MGDKTSDESDDEFDRKTSDGSDIEERVKDSSIIRDSSGDESDNDKLEELLTELRISSEHRPPGLIPPTRKSSLMVKLSERLTICEQSSIALSFDEQTKCSTLRKQDQMMLDFAKSGKNRELMTLLVHTGANIDSRDISGNTGHNKDFVVAATCAFVQAVHSNPKLYY